MTIYVDDIQRYPSGPWCHMWTDGDIGELHHMADKIGLKREWFQQKNPRFPHYDLRPSRRDKALQAGARRMSLRKWIESGKMKQATRSTEIDCPNCAATAKLIKVGPDGMEYRCPQCQVVTLKSSDQPYTA